MSEHEPPAHSTLSPKQRGQLQGLLERRRSIAKTFTVLASVLCGVGVVRILIKVPRRDRLIGIAGCALIVALVALLVWYAGWRRVIAMRRDLAAGVVASREGTLEKLTSTDNAYGETITTAYVDGMAHVTREAMFNGLKVGDRIALDYLPLSRVPLAVRRAGANDPSDGV